MLRRYDRFDPEANITSAVRDFLILTGLANRDEIAEENPPSTQDRRQAVDLTALDTFIEVKRRIGSTNGIDPNPQNVQQLDDYLDQSETPDRGVRMGILTDGKHWLLRWRGAGDVKTIYPYAFTLKSGEQWFLLFEWLRDKALVSRVNILPEYETIKDHFGPDSPSYERDIDALRDIYRDCARLETVKLKRRLWQDLLRAALGEIAGTPEQLDDLFVRHTYLSAVIGLVLQAAFGIDIYRMAEADPDDLLLGRRFRNATGLQGVVETDFFAWPVEVGAMPLVRTIARRMARFDWSDTPPDIAATLYETIIPPEERRRLGEYYTPKWLAREMVDTIVDDPLRQRVLDPACGSGTFLTAAIACFLDAAHEAGPIGEETFSQLRRSVIGLDVHPVAVHLARAAYMLAAKPAIEVSHATSVSVPVYLGDALQLRFRSGTLFAQDAVTIDVQDEEDSQLVFPISIIDRADEFDALMSDIAEYIENDESPTLALDENGITDQRERAVMSRTILILQKLHRKGRDHIWAYYTRNLVRPVALARNKVDVIIGNPPWINYNQSSSLLRSELVRQSKEIYGIWAGGRYATHQDVAGLFFARCVDLYLHQKGIIGMVMPHSALQTGQFAKWRSGIWRGEPGTRPIAVDFQRLTAWDLERLQPNTFFPIPASVVFASPRPSESEGVPLQGDIEQWIGEAGTDRVERVRTPITDTSEIGVSPYAARAMQGATIVPRCLFFVNEAENPAIIKAANTIAVNPRRGVHDKAPWKSLDLDEITGQTIERDHVFDVHLGETVVPYATLDPLQAVLPLKRDAVQLGIADPEADPNDQIGGIGMAHMHRRLRARWRIVNRIWEENKSPNNKLSLLGQLDYFGKLSSQLAWQRNRARRPVRILYTGSGQPTATILHDENATADYTLFWITCANIAEANYLIAIINSQELYTAAKPFMARGQFGARHLQKHLWKLPIPEFDANDRLHIDISEAGRVAAEGTALQLARLYEERDRVTVTIARRELRKWLRESAEGEAVEKLVGRLLR